MCVVDFYVSLHAIEETSKGEKDAGPHAAAVADVVGDALAARGAERVGAERARDGDARHVARLYILREAAVAEVLLRAVTGW